MKKKKREQTGISRSSPISKRITHKKIESLTLFLTVKQSMHNLKTVGNNKKKIEMNLNSNTQIAKSHKKCRKLKTPQNSETV